MNILGAAREGQVGGLHMLSCNRELPMEVCSRLLLQENEKQNVELKPWASFHPSGHLSDFYSALPRMAAKQGTMNLEAKYKPSHLILQIILLGTDFSKDLPRHKRQFPFLPSPLLSFLLILLWDKRQQNVCFPWPEVVVFNWKSSW